jgi:hypothetical protein
MTALSDTELILNQIKKTISLWSEGSLSLDNAKNAYHKLHDQYLKLERKYISENSQGFLKGLLHHHNMVNNAALTALFSLREDSVVPLVFAGDTILLGAIPGLIHKKLEDLNATSASQLPLGDRGGQAFTLFAQKIEIGRDTIIPAAVASTSLFNNIDFSVLVELLSTVYRKNRELFSPVMLNYVNDISSEISKLFDGGKNGPVYADLFILYNPPGAFAGAGIYNLIDFSHFIVKTLKMVYPAHANIFALSLANYFVLYDENTKMGLEIKPNRIDFNYHGNNIPYKVVNTEIGTQQQLYLFLESL